MLFYLILCSYLITFAYGNSTEIRTGAEVKSSSDHGPDENKPLNGSIPNGTVTNLNKLEKDFLKEVTGKASKVVPRKSAPETETNNASEKEPARTPKPKPTVLSNRDLEALKTNDIKLETIKSNKHPGLVMPIVFAILVVPMFAVMLYMGVRRGREAWNNRHYKRMDFLLDGMYND